MRALMTCWKEKSLDFMLAIACSVHSSADQPPSRHCRLKKEHSGHEQRQPQSRFVIVW